MPQRSGPGPSWDVVGIGANSVDFVYLVPGYPARHGAFSKMPIRAQMTCGGGQMATALATCARLGLRAKYIGATGNDANGALIRRKLGSLGIDTTGVVTREGRNQFAVIIVDDTTGERIVLWDRDDRLRLDAGDVTPEVIRTARLVHVDDTDQAAAIRAATLAREAGIPCTSDLDRLTERTEELVAAVSVPIFAENLPNALSGERDPEAALRQLRRHHDGLFVVTLGPRGAMALDGDRLIHVPGFEVEAVDTTGAGDVFRGGFIYGLLQQWPVDRVLRFANAAAAVSCTRTGALDSVPSLEDTRRLLEPR
jgi:sulfofructose kinase